MSNFDSYKSPKGEASADTNSIIAVSQCLTKIFSFQFRLYFMIQVGVFPMFCARKTASSSAQCWSREKKFLSTRRKRRRPRRIRKIHFYFPVTFSHSDSNFFFPPLCCVPFEWKISFSCCEVDLCSFQAKSYSLCFFCAVRYSSVAWYSWNKCNIYLSNNSTCMTVGLAGAAKPTQDVVCEWSEREMEGLTAITIINDDIPSDPSSEPQQSIDLDGDCVWFGEDLNYGMRWSRQRNKIKFNVRYVPCLT